MLRRGGDHALVTSGRYPNASKVIRKGLSLLERRDAEDEAGPTAIRAAANRGWAAVVAGRLMEIDDADQGDAIADIGAAAVTDSQSKL